MQKQSKSGHKAAVRIIGGRWRGRRIRFKDEGVRPTGDRVRETLFNWLSGRIAGARCLDMFAGSGALGLEALSRGASAVVFVEKNKVVARQLERNLAELGPAAAQVLVADALHLPLAEHGPFDIVFLDPPFASPYAGNLCTLLATADCLAPAALIYVEAAKASPLPELPEGFAVLREQTAGQVRYALLARQVAQESRSID